MIKRGKTLLYFVNVLLCVNSEEQYLYSGILRAQKIIILNVKVKK